MFVRAKTSGKYQYLQVVENQRVDGRVQQRVMATLGRLDVLQQSGQLDALVSSCARFSQKVAVLEAHRAGRTQTVRTVRVGPPLVFDRLWRELGMPQLLGRLLKDRRYEFDVERAVFLTVLHRLFPSGSDRAAEVWREKYAIDGVQDLELHHLYRAMAWLGEELPSDAQDAATKLAPRCTKDLIEEALFDRRRDLFSGLELVFFDTTSIYFEGRGGETLGQFGHSKDHRPDRRQMVVAAILDSRGRPICCELWPGNTTDVTTLIPVIDRLKRRFHIAQIVIVADRGMISRQTIEQLQASDRQVRFILGARLRNVKEIRETVLSHPGRYHEVHPPRQTSLDPSPLKVKNVTIEDRRYVVCFNSEQAQKDRADRDAILKSLEDQLRDSPKKLVGNKGYRKYLKSTGACFAIDLEKVKSEARFDGKWVLQTDLDLSAEEVALNYKELWMVETLFRTAKSILETRPIYHKCDETIRGHVFCSFLALVLLKELYDRLESRGWTGVEWQRLKDDLEMLQELTVETGEKTFVLRTELQGNSGKAIQAAGVALGPTIQIQATSEEKPTTKAT
ncbi:MAG: IS1634 family transposase [Gammaproteobacteria bacterium]